MWKKNVNSSFFHLDMSMDGSPSYTKSRHKSLVLASGIREPPSFGLHTTGRHHSPVLPMKPSMNPQNVLFVANTPAWNFSVRWRLWWWTHFLISPPCQYITDLKSNWWDDGMYFIQQFFCFLPRKLINKFSGPLATLQVKLLEIFLFSFLQLPCMEHTPASSGASTSSYWCWEGGGGRIWFCCHLFLALVLRFRAARLLLN